MIERNSTPVSLPENAHRSSCVPKNVTAISYATQKNSRPDGQPAADGALGNPRRSEHCRRYWEEANTSSTAAAGLGKQDDEQISRDENQPVTRQAEEKSSRQNRKLDQKTSGTGDLVIRLPNPLRPEMLYGGRASQYIDIRAHNFPAACCRYGTHKLEILEHRAAVIAVGHPQGGPADAERSRPIPARNAIEQRASGVPHSVEWKRREVILGPHNIVVIQRCHQGLQRLHVVAHIIVRYDHSLVRGKAEAGQNSADFPHWSLESGIETYMQCRRAESDGIGIENFAR